MARILRRLQIAATTLLLGLALCQPALGRSDSPVLDRIVESKELRVAMSVNQPPFNMRNPAKEVIGFDVDLARALARAMQVELRIVELPFAELLQAVEAGKADIAISGITITPDRTRKVSFVGPYTLSGKSILTTARIKKVVTSNTDFNDAEIRIVALSNSTSESFVTGQLPQAGLHSIPNYNEGIQMLLTGAVDAMVADNHILKLVLLRYPDAELGIIEPQLSVEPLGLAIARGDSQFENLLRNYLHGLEQAGFLPGLRQKWFDNSDWMGNAP